MHVILKKKGNLGRSRKMCLKLESIIDTIVGSKRIEKYDKITMKTVMIEILITYYNLADFIIQQLLLLR